MLNCTISTIAFIWDGVTTIGVNKAVFTAQGAIHESEVTASYITFNSCIALLAPLHNIARITTPATRRTNTTTSIKYARIKSAPRITSQRTLARSKTEISTSNSTNTTIALLTTLKNVITTIFRIVLTIRLIKFARVCFIRIITHQSAKVISLCYASLTIEVFTITIFASCWVPPIISADRLRDIYAVAEIK